MTLHSECGGSTFIMTLVILEVVIATQQDGGNRLSMGDGLIQLKEERITARQVNEPHVF